jgi:hypothetical protein
MHDLPQRRRFISPALLLAILLCFFLPFFSVSCSSGVGQMKATVTGMDQVFGGEPEYSGFRPPPTGDAVKGQEEKSQISPTALTGFAAIVVGVGLGLGLPRPRARWISGAVASGIALVAVVVNQVMIHRRAQDALDQAASSWRDQLADNPIFGQSIPMPALELGDESGFWVVTGLLGLVVAYNVFEIVLLQRRPNQLPRLAAGGAGVPVPPPLPPMSGSAPGWPPGPLPRPQATRPSGPSPGPRVPLPRPQGSPPTYPPDRWQAPHHPPHQMPGYPPTYWPHNP